MPVSIAYHRRINGMICYSETFTEAKWNEPTHYRAAAPGISALELGPNEPKCRRNRQRVPEYYKSS